MALRSFSRWLCGCTAIAAAGASIALVCAPCVARAQYVQYATAPPPPPPPPPPPYYNREYREQREGLSAFAVGIDLEGVAPVNGPQLADGNSLNGGGGIKVRVGDQIRFTRWLRVTPEAGYGYDHLFASNDYGAGTAYSWDMNRVFGGVRIAFGRVLVPSVYGHVGYGWRATSEPAVLAANGAAVDVGAALDFRIVRQLQFGLHGEWVTIDAQPYAPEWVAMGAHVDLAL